MERQGGAGKPQDGVLLLVRAPVRGYFLETTCLGADEYNNNNNRATVVATSAPPLPTCIPPLSPTPTPTPTPTAVLAFPPSCAGGAGAHRAPKSRDVGVGGGRWRRHRAGLAERGQAEPLTAGSRWVPDPPAGRGASCVGYFAFRERAQAGAAFSQSGVPGHVRSVGKSRSRDMGVRYETGIGRRHYSPSLVKPSKLSSSKCSARNVCCLVDGFDKDWGKVSTVL